MNKSLQNIINKLRTDNRDYTDFKTLLAEIEKSEDAIVKDDILELVENDFRLQLHTTPNGIAQMMAEIGKPNHYNNAIDICCGTGNILYYLQNQIDDLTGVEISENVAALTSYFNHDIKLITADSFHYTFSKYYDLVVGNLPWGMPVVYNGKHLKSEEAFIRKAFDLCNLNGEIIFIVPYNLLFGTAFSEFRKEFSANLKLILGLPAETMRNTNVKTAILHFSKQLNDKVEIGLIDYVNDIGKSYKNFIKNEIKSNELQNRWDPEYFISHEKSVYKELANIETKKLEEFAAIIKGKSFKPDVLQDEGDFLYLKPIHIQGDHLDYTKATMYVQKEHLKESHFQCIAQPGDIIISTIFTDLKLYIFKKGDPPSIISNNLAIIRSANDDYIMSYLQTEDGRRIFSEQAKDIRIGITIPHISIKDLQSILIPILPIANLNSFGDRNIEKSDRDELLNHKFLLNELRMSNNRESPPNFSIVHESKVIYSLKERNEDYVSFNFIIDRLHKIELQLKKVNKKLDNLLEVFNDLSSDFLRIKNIERNEEERIFKLCQTLDQKLNIIYKEQTLTIENYIEGIKRWLDLWDILDIESKKFLPIAEFIFDELNRIPEADYSPFIVQYCRALENEILKKLFEMYHAEGLNGVNRKELVLEDLANEGTSVFAKMVIKDDMRYELGKMSRIMSYLKEGGNTLKNSKLLQHFRAFVVKYFEKQILANDFLNDLDKIRDEFRNKAAHPHILELHIAKECQVLLRKNLNLFLESQKI